MTVRRLNLSAGAGLLLLPALMVLQSSLALHVTILGVHPDFVLSAVVDWGIIRGVEAGMLWGLIGGLFVDLYSGLPFGTSALAYVLIAGLTSLGEGTLIRTHPLLPLAAVISATLLYYVVAIFMVASVRHVVLFDHRTVGIVAAEAVYNGLVNVPGFMLMQLLDRKLNPVPRVNW